MASAKVAKCLLRMDLSGWVNAGGRREYTDTTRLNPIDAEYRVAREIRASGDGICDINRLDY